MSIPVPKKSMILAAGLGRRLRPYTDDIPKALLPVAGKPLIDWALGHLEQAGVDDTVVNVHYRADKLRAHLEKRMFPRVHFMVEEELLGTGGAVREALPLLGKTPFYLLHSNIIWVNKSRPALERLPDYWDDSKMDVLALVVEKDKLPWYKGTGDFVVDDTEYRLRRANPGEQAPLVAAGMYLIHPRLFANTSDGAFPLSILLDAAKKKGRFYGLLHEGEWYSVTTAHEYQAITKILSD
jgi:MurNAc alpha-1-phosphate uridylyltransferase